MSQEDSNGESSFEIIDRKQPVISQTASGTSSSISSLSIVSPPTPISATGNLLSNVAPPASLPDFSLYTGPTPIMLSAPLNVTQASNLPTATAAPTPQIVNIQPSVQPVVPQTSKKNPPPLSTADQFPASQFSAAIPPNKGVPQPALSQQSSENKEELRSGFIGVFKDAFSSGGVLSKMAEKAKNSMDSIITTLDPQMSEYINSGGDTVITVTSEIDDEVGAIREAIHSVFGKAWVNGMKLNLPSKTQAIGFEEGLKNVEEKLEYSLKFRKTPTIVIENILFQQQNEWYNVTLLVLRDSERNINLKTFSHGIPVPVEQILKATNSVAEYKLLNTEQKLAKYMQENPGWREIISGSTDKETILLPARTLIKIYKTKIEPTKK